MASWMKTSFGLIGVTVACSVFFAGTGAVPAVASADPLIPAGDAIYRLNPDSTYQQGCFPPCLCPIMEQRGVRGTFKLTYTGLDGPVETYAVDDVNWTAPFDERELRIVGSGIYQVGSPDPAAVMQHRMRLDLKVGDEPVQHFDSGWVMIGDVSRIGITVSIHGMYCWDTAIIIDASPVPNDQIHPYALVAGSTFQRGCYNPCDCQLSRALPMVGTFDLVPLEKTPPFMEFAVVNVDWRAFFYSVPEVFPITGFGRYTIFAEFAVQHRLALDLVVGIEPRTHYDSGLVVGGLDFPRIDAVVSIRGIECFDTVLHVIAEPVTGEVCGGVAGIPCDEGEFCKLPAGRCCCDFTGVCTPIPTGCPEVWSPVCGCDGVTYSNECEADAASVSIAYYGECRQICSAEHECSDAYEFCKFPEGSCGDTTVKGLCVPTRGGCPPVWAPVCGCDGITYENECQADMAGTSVDHRGECQPACRPTDDGSGCVQVTCSPIPEEQCIPTVLHLNVHTGAITVLACECMDVNHCHIEFGDARPVAVGWCPDGGACQVLGRDTDNDGIDDTFTAECVPGPIGVCCVDISDGLVAYETCLELDEPTCHAAGGMFYPVNTGCSEIQACCFLNDPTVTFCEDMSPYCCIASGGVPQGPDSTCENTTCGQVCGGFAGIPCDDPDEFCKFPLGTCEWADLFGICTPVPEGCPPIWDPVCGCDGITYGSECESDMARMSLDHFGVCDTVCEPLPDGSGCTPLPCSPIPEDMCLPTVLRLSPETGDLIVAECECIDFNLCHIELADGAPVAVGYCPDNGTCQVVGIDMDGDGVEDHFTAECLPGEVGACCMISPAIPLPVPTCVEVTEEICVRAHGVFLGVGTTCEPTQACCLPVDNASFCVDINPLCCDAFGGISQNRSLSCVDEPCGEVCGGIAGIPCSAADEFCKFPAGTCGLHDVSGICTPIPVGCPDAMRDPVCGCDGVTYDNECESDMAGVSIDHRGECGQICGGFAGIPCDDPNEFCKFPEGTCDWADIFGVCTPIPDECPDVWEPVCGCDGVTYANECEADRATVSLRHRGPCGQICGDFSYLPPCPEDEFCKYPEGTCGAHYVTGICTPFPDACPFLYDPVCGCNGVTYPNECTSDAAGVSVAHRGECSWVCCDPAQAPPCPDPVGPYCCADGHWECSDPSGIPPCEPGIVCRPVCGGPHGIPCEELRDFCKFPVGTCGRFDVFGMCTPRPETCPEYPDPVCGCDGVTYENPCFADAAGVSIAHWGACEPQYCWSNDMCRPDQYCFFHDCAAETGVCMPRPTDCPEIWDPVCGCDGVTYPNACEAARAGMSVDYPGECERTCSRIDPYPPCHPDEFCKFPPGTCGDPAVFGVCTLIPEACPEVYDPVCGCDGVTHDNECFADMARMSIDYFGECDGPPCAATRGLSCPELSYCPGVPKNVQIHLNPSGVSTFSLYDSPPEGWLVTFISHDGEFDSASWQVRWGPFTVPDIPRSVGYTVVPPDNASGVVCFSGEISVEGINQPICGDQCIDSLCCPFMAADLPQPPCQACPFGDCTACSNPACRDGRISLCELIGYACAWKRGCHDDMAGLTRAAYIWLHGECYCWDDVADNWFPTRCPPPASGCCREANPGASSGSPVQARLTDTGRTVAHIDYTSDGRKGAKQELEIPITVEAPEGTSAVSLDFRIPDAWEVTAISDGGQWDEIHRKVKWGPFSEELSRTVTLTVRRLTDERRLTARGRKARVLPHGISGMVSYDGVNYPIAIGR